MKPATILPDQGLEQQRIMPQQKDKTMPKESVFCLALSRDLANQIVDRVKTSGFFNHDISALFPSQDAAFDLAREKSAGLHRREPLSASQRTAWWAARRSGFASIGVLTVPGAGLFVAAGPIIFALSGAVVSGAGGGGLAGALFGMGISELEARRIESRIKEGNILISVHTGNPAEITLAKTIFREAGAQCICATNEASLKVGSPTGTRVAPGECSATDFCGDGQETKSLNGQRGVGSVVEGSSRLVSLAL